MQTPDSNRAREALTSSAALAQGTAEPAVVDVLRIEEPDHGEGRRDVIVRWSHGSTGRALPYFAALCGHPHKSAYDDSPFMPTRE